MLLNRLKDVDYEGLMECCTLSQPKLGKKFIPLIISEAAQRTPIVQENYSFLISVVYYLTAPYKNFYNELKLEIGARDLIKDGLFIVNGEMINHYSAPIPAHYKNPRWRKRVEDLGNEIFKTILDLE